MTNYAQYEDKCSKLASDFGESLARKWFGDDLIDTLPKYVRGKNKGKPKGYLRWRKIVKGGWKHHGTFGPGDYAGEVVYPNQIPYKWIELQDHGCDAQIIAGQSPYQR